MLKTPLRLAQCLSGLSVPVLLLNACSHGGLGVSGWSLASVSVRGEKGLEAPVRRVRGQAG